MKTGCCAVWLLLAIGAMPLQPATAGTLDAIGLTLWTIDTGG